MSRQLLRTAIIAVLVLAAIPATASASPVLPSQDPFYTPPASISSLARGAIIRSRTISIAEAGLSLPISATQVIYRTTDQLGHPAVTVATIIKPLLAAPSKLVSYQTAYDDLGGTCDPSYTLQGGNPGNSDSEAEQAVILLYVAQGDAVVVPDYEGEDLAYGAGQQSGYQTLDGIRAAENLLKLGTSTPVALVGYSGGSIASEYAAELAPSYAPKLDLVGTAIGGIPVDYAHNLAYINGTPSWSDVLPAIFVGLSRGFGIDIDKYLSPLGVQLAKQDASQCIQSYLGSRPGLTYQQLLKPQYRDILAVPMFAKIFNRETMSYTGTPREPLFMGVGDVDGTGDGVMVDRDVEALAHTYCARGPSVQFTEYSGEDHVSAALSFEPAALEFVSDRLGGVQTPNGCASIGSGNSLALLPVSAGTPKLRIHYLGPRHRHHGVWLQLWTSTGTLKHLVLKLHRAGKVVDTIRIASVSTRGDVLVLRVKHKLPTAGRYTITVGQSGKTLIKRKERIR